jgi:hypothetical protein
MARTSLRLANSVQVDGQGTFDGQPAMFRVQVTDNANNNGFFSSPAFRDARSRPAAPGSGAILRVTNP